MHEDILILLEGKWADGTRPKDVYSNQISRDPEAYLGSLLDGLGSPKRKVQSGCAEIASLLSEERPELLYPHVHRFVENLDAREPVLRWEAVCTLGNLARLDEKGTIPPQVDRISEFLKADSIVLQGHAVKALSKIAIANEELKRQILERLLGAVDLFPGNRRGFLIEAMEAFVDDDELVPLVREFVQPYSQSEIHVVARKARRLLRKLP